MSHLGIKWPASLLLLVLLATLMGHAQTTPVAPVAGPSAALAGALLLQSGIARGIVALPRCGDGQLALALAQHDGVLVHAMDADRRHVDALAGQAADAGILGRSLYVAESSPATIPFTDDYVNLLVVTDATGSNLAELRWPEIVRVLVPATGKAVIGLAKGTPGTLTRVQLLNWLKGCTGATVSIAEDRYGIWAWLTKEPTPGAVAWTHRLFSPANNPMTPDSAAAWPLMTRWLGKPYLAQEPEVLVANGRMAGLRLVGWGNQSVLDMHDAHNGLLLWQRAMPDASVATRTSGMVLLPNALYLAEKADILLFDPTTGQETTRVDCSVLGQQVKWLAVQDGTLYAMSGSLEKQVMAHQTWKVFGTVPDNFGMCGALGAYDLKEKKWRWTQQETADTLNEGMIGMNNGKLFYYSSEKGLYCRDGKTGAVVWQNPKIIDSVKQFLKNGDNRGHIGAIICSDRVLAIHRANNGTLMIAADTGELLWNTSAADVVFYQDILLRKGGAASCVDPLTGKAVTSTLTRASLGGGCGAFSLSQNLLCGQMGVTFDLKNQRPLDTNGYGPIFHKSPCLAGTYVAEGLLLMPDGACSCDYHVRGTIVQATASPADTLAPAVQLRLRVPTDTTVKPFPVDTRDWPTFRAGEARANASHATVCAATPAVRWSWKATTGLPAPVDLFFDQGASPLQSNHEPVQTSCAGPLIFATRADGSVTALDLTTGAVRWRFITEGRLYTPPTIAEDRCYIGSGDGCVYCLEAATGRELWRYRVAPTARLMMVYGDLESTWPITGGVLLHDGVAYAIAGNLDVDGTYVVALDARTGVVKWRNDTSGHLNPQRGTGVSGCGFPTIAHGRLWLRTASYDLATGACRPWLQPAVGATQADVEKGRSILLRYTGCFANNFLIFGGRRFFSDHSIGQVSQTRDRGDLFIAALGDDGAAKLPMSIPWPNCRTLPAWDDRTLIAMPTVYNSKIDRSRDDELVCWDVPKAVVELQNEIDAGSKNPMLLGDKTTLKVKELDRARGDDFSAPQQLWTASAEWFVASVLADNAVVAVYGVKPEGNYRPFRDVPTADKLPYKISAYNRIDGTILWTASLPGQPLMDGLSIARDGSIIVQMLDGSVLCFAAPAAG